MAHVFDNVDPQVWETFALAKLSLENTSAHGCRRLTDQTALHLPANHFLRVKPGGPDACLRKGKNSWKEDLKLVGCPSVVVDRQEMHVGAGGP